MSGDVNKLPKWAQAEIRRLEGCVDYWKGIALAGPADTNTFVGHGLDDDKPLERDARVKFQLGDERWDQYVSAHVEGSHLYIQGGRSFAVLPNSSNVVIIQLRDRH